MVTMWSLRWPSPLAQASRTSTSPSLISIFFLFQAEDGIRDTSVTGGQTCALPIWHAFAFGFTNSPATPVSREPARWDTVVAGLFVNPKVKACRQIFF